MWRANYVHKQLYAVSYLRGSVQNILQTFFFLYLWIFDPG